METKPPLPPKRAFRKLLPKTAVAAAALAGAAVGGPASVLLYNVFGPNAKTENRLPPKEFDLKKADIFACLTPAIDAFLKNNTIASTAAVPGKLGCVVKPEEQKLRSAMIVAELDTTVSFRSMTYKFYYDRDGNIDHHSAYFKESGFDPESRPKLVPYKTPDSVIVWMGEIGEKLIVKTPTYTNTP